MIRNLPQRTADLYLIITSVIMAGLIMVISAYPTAAAAAMDVLLVLLALAAAHVLRRTYDVTYESLWVFDRIPLSVIYVLPAAIGGIGLVKSILDHDYDRSILRTLLVVYCVSAFIILHPLTPLNNRPLLSRMASGR